MVILQIIFLAPGLIQLSLYRLDFNDNFIAKDALVILRQAFLFLTSKCFSSTSVKLAPDLARWL